MVGAVTAGTKLGHYECTAALHDSDLWLARSDEGEHVVLRILTAEQVQDPKFVRMSDAWGSNELHQASIAGIEDIAEEQGIHYVATEYVHGEALVQLLARVEERGNPNVVRALLQHRANGQLDDVRIRAVQRSELRRIVEHLRRVQAVALDHARHLDARPLG